MLYKIALSALFLVVAMQSPGGVVVGGGVLAPKVKKHPSQGLPESHPALPRRQN